MLHFSTTVSNARCHLSHIHLLCKLPSHSTGSLMVADRIQCKNLLIFGTFHIDFQILSIFSIYTIIITIVSKVSLIRMPTATSYTCVCKVCCSVFVCLCCVNSRWSTWVVRVGMPQKIFKPHSQISRLGMWTICFPIYTEGLLIGLFF